MEIKTIGVVGAGQMGNGIVQVAAQSGYNVVMRDIDQKFIDKGMASIEKNLSWLADKEKITADDKQKALDKIKTTLDLTALKACDLIIEAIPEKINFKKECY